MPLLSLLCWLTVPAPLVAPPGSDPGSLTSLVKSEVSGDKAHAIVEKLVSFGTRHSLADASSPSRGVGAARNWIKAELERYSTAAGGRLQVSFEEFEQPPARRMPEGGLLVNVLAVLPGTMPEAADRRYYVVGHYDSRNGKEMDVTGDAPGANDDASGVAVVMELARVLADKKLDATVVFLATAGEEEGLYGAQYHAAQAAARHEKIMGVLNNDIVGDPSGPADIAGSPASVKDRIRVFSEGVPRNPSAEVLANIRNLAGEWDSPSRELARFVEEAGALDQTAVKAMLVFRPDRFLRGGDHLAFNDNGFPAVRFTSVYENYDRQHQDVTEKDGKPYGDVARFVDAEYLGNVARLNGVALVRLANAPSPPGKARIITAKLENATTIKWEKSPEPDVAGYEVVWRDTTSARWETTRDVGNVTEITVPIGKDNVFFGVRTYDRDGYRSPVAFVAAAKE